MWLKIIEHPQLYWGVLAIGIALCASALFLTKRKIKFLRLSIVTNGRVISNDYRGDVWYPTIEFLDFDDEPIQFSCVGSGPNKAYEVGDVVSIRYDSETPSSAHIDKFWRVWFDIIICWALGLAWCWAALRNL